MTTLRIQVAPRVGPANPRGSRWAAAAFVALSQWLARFGRQQLARTRTPLEEARAVRELASQYRSRDPRFAADLFAAADRHERVHGVN